MLHAGTFERLQAQEAQVRHSVASKHTLESRRDSDLVSGGCDAHLIGPNNTLSLHHLRCVVRWYGIGKSMTHLLPPLRCCKQRFRHTGDETSDGMSGQPGWIRPDGLKQQTLHSFLVHRRDIHQIIDNVRGENGKSSARLMSREQKIL